MYFEAYKIARIGEWAKTRRDDHNAGPNHLPRADIHFELRALADPQVAELGFLEIRIHPDVAQRADRHEALADLHIVAGIHVASRDDAVDLRDNGAIAQVELRLLRRTLR
jgi:hypothetical protein